MSEFTRSGYVYSQQVSTTTIDGNVVEPSENTWSGDVEPETGDVVEPEEDFEIVDPEEIVEVVDPEESVEVVDHVEVSEKPVPPPKPENIAVVPRAVTVAANE